MQNIILTTPEQLEDIINKCLSKYIATPNPEPKSEPESVKFLYSLKELAEFLACSVVTAQKLKNSGRIRYKQYGRKVIFNASQILQDLEKSGRRSK